MMWLPVMNHTNNAISNPNARDVSDARMLLGKSYSLTWARLIYLRR